MAMKTTDYYFGNIVIMNGNGSLEICHSCQYLLSQK